MNTETRNDLKINGSGKASGGFYNNVVINGAGEINGNIDCINFKINGSGRIKGSVKTSNGKISGTSDIEKNYEGNELKVNGTTKISGESKVKSLKVNGTLDINASMKGEEAEIYGAIKIGSDCTVERFKLRGGFTILGLLNAGEIEVEFYGPCKVKEIGGEKINITQGHSFGLRKLLKSFFSLFDIKDCLTVDTIEGDDIFIEYTYAKIVRGNNITIGEGCEIDLVEYKNNFKAADNAKVTESRKIL